MKKGIAKLYEACCYHDKAALYYKVSKTAWQKEIHRTVRTENC